MGIGDDQSVGSFAPLPTFGGDEPWNGSVVGSEVDGPASQSDVSYTQSSFGTYQNYMDKSGSDYSQGSGLEGYYYDDDTQGSEGGYSQNSYSQNSYA